MASWFLFSLEIIKQILLEWSLMIVLAILLIGLSHKGSWVWREKKKYWVKILIKALSVSSLCQVTNIISKFFL